MANFWNLRAYQQNTTRPATADWESVSVTPRSSGVVYRQEISLSLAAGLSNVAPDRAFLITLPGSIFTGAAGVRLSRLYLVGSGDVGGTTTFNLGWLNAGQTVYGSALTNLQGTTALDVAIATLLATPLVTAPDSLVMTIASAGPSTTARTVSGFLDFTFNRPV